MGQPSPTRLSGRSFTDVARIDLTRHLPIMADFWETVLFGTGTYHRDALQVHMVLHARTPLDRLHFARWLGLWETMVRERFAGDKADLAVVQAHRMAGSIERRLAGHPAATSRQSDSAVPPRSGLNHRC
jgi:hemoglobin